MRSWSLFVVESAGILALHACASLDRQAEDSAQPAAVSPAVTGAPSVCAGYLTHTSVSLADLPEGVLLSYSAQPNDVQALREAVRHFAAQQNGSQPRTDIDRTRGAAGSLTAPGTTLLLPGVRAMVSETPTGANLVLAPVPPAMRELLRKDVHAGRCAGFAQVIR